MVSSSDHSQILDILSQRKLKIIQVLSRSPRSLVIECQDLGSKQLCVVKCGRLADGSLLNKERQFLSKVRHPNIVRLLDSFQAKGILFLVLGKVPGISLIQYLLQKGPLNEVEASSLARQLVSTLAFIHSKGWIHRDIKPDNLIYDETTNNVTLIDFEFSFRKRLWVKHKEQNGTLEYSAPEVRRGTALGPAIDVWSLGVTMYVLVNGYFPFHKEDLIRGKERLNPVPKVSSLECHDLISKILVTETKHRFTLREIAKHPWLQTSGQIT